ncbi:MAG: AlwI family type II restriction endonuclease [Prevotella sp.]
MGKTIHSRMLFLTTSPRSPEKMIPEIELLVDNFSGVKWNRKSQEAFMDRLRETDFFQGCGDKDPAFSARDRMTRAPKCLGFIVLKPKIQLTPAGQKLLSSRRTDEVFLRQLLKFQIPSPYHKPSVKATRFCIKPYLELLRLIHRMGTLKFDELQIFGMQLTDYRDFDKIVGKIEQFRKDCATSKIAYKKFKAETLRMELMTIFKNRIKSGKTKTRGSRDKSIDKFLSTQANNMRDYADACFRYLRATGLVNVSHVGKSLSIVPERLADVEFVLENVDRKPVYVNDEEAYLAYLGDASLPRLLADDRQLLENRIFSEFPNASIPEEATVDDLKDQLADMLDERRLNSIESQKAEIKDYRQYDDIQNIYDQLPGKKIYDAPLMLEWNTWRAMTMLDGGDIKANLSFDDYGQPMSTAAGNMSDIVCDYGDFMVCVEVTMASGQKQYEMEGEPVTRHLGKLNVSTDKPCYCLFIAPKINEACISYFYSMHKIDLEMYGGKLTIVPLPLSVFRKMVEASFNADYTPKPKNIEKLFISSNEYASKYNEREWYKMITEKALHWLE